MKLGIDSLIESHQNLLDGKRIGVLAHQASVNAAGEYTVTRLSESTDWHVRALFGPEHGIQTSAQDMEEVPSDTDPDSQIPIFSLYGDDPSSLSPTPNMLEHIDTLVIDLQDIGSRYYTYAWTTILAVRACAEHKKEVIICDRPNPLGGLAVEGPEIEPEFESFVGLYSIPVRHGLTMGEIVRLFNKQEKIGCELHIIPMEEWKREMRWLKTRLKWINPSPNMRSYQAALLYPGMCLVEATNCSEGRGTPTPFEIIGAPYIQSNKLIEKLESLNLAGILAKPRTFIPTSQKQARKKCHGIQWKITDEETFKPYRTGLALIWALFQLYEGKGFEWRSEPYEFVSDIPAIDLLTGSDTFRKKITTRDFQEIAPLAEPPASYLNNRQPYLLYK